MIRITVILLLSSMSLFSQKSDSISIYYFLAEDCKICQYYSLTMNELHEEFASDSVAFIGLFPNHFSTEEGIQNFKEKYNIPFPLKREYFQTKTKLFGATITPEVVVYNESKKQIIYQGRIDDSYYKIGRRRQVITTNELESVLSSIQKGEKPNVESIKPIGCFISLKN